MSKSDVLGEMVGKGKREERWRRDADSAAKCVPCYYWQQLPAELTIDRPTLQVVTVKCGQLTGRSADCWCNAYTSRHNGGLT